MVRHIVFWQLKDELKQSDAQKVIDDLRESFTGLAGRIDGMTHIDFGVNYKEGAYDIALCCEFMSREAEAAYQDNPLHVAVKGAPPWTTNFRNVRQGTYARSRKSIRTAAGIRTTV